MFLKRYFKFLSVMETSQYALENTTMIPIKERKTSTIGKATEEKMRKIITAIDTAKTMSARNCNCSQMVK